MRVQDKHNLLEFAKAHQRLFVTSADHKVNK